MALLAEFVFVLVSLFSVNVEVGEMCLFLRERLTAFVRITYSGRMSSIQILT